jgi:hypothetical protein
MSKLIHFVDLSRPQKKRCQFLLDVDTVEALETLQRDMGAPNATDAIQAAILLSRWILERELEGAKLAIVNGKTVEAVKIKLDWREKAVAKSKPASTTSASGATNTASEDAEMTVRSGLLTQAHAASALGADRHVHTVTKTRRQARHAKK